MHTSQTDADLASRLDKLYEFEREPVTEDQLHPGRRFAALYAGEHVAATEFVIGVLFVQWGAGARDLVWGLLLGNALAVLSWALICAPIAVRTRLTLYWYVRRIVGPGLTVIYNFVNAVLYCCLAAAMIGVSASAVIIALDKLLGLHIKHPAITDVYPNSVGWVVIVLLVGAVVIVLAIAGFKKLAQFSSVCAPWMLLIFIAGALASLPRLGEFRSARGFWQLAETRIWNGQPYEQLLFAIPSMHLDSDTAKEIPAALRKELQGKDRLAVPPEATLSMEKRAARWQLLGLHKHYVIQRLDPPDKNGNHFGVYTVLPKLGFMHIMFFAWFCNLAMHIGLSDMAIFRYARSWTYGFYSAFGMYLGHFLAWICAGVMGAAFGAGLQPGPMADTAAGLAGVLAVLLAGWTTANPTIYRAGLALQIITPNWPRWSVTLVAGVITAFVACFPAIFMRLLDFVAIYGLMLMPIGAVIFVEHWVFPKLGLVQYWTERRKLWLNPAAGITWLIVLVLSFPIEDFSPSLRSPMAMLGIHLFFRWLPGWFIAAGLYIVLAALMGARNVPPATEPESPSRHHVSRAAPSTPAASGGGLIVWIAGAVAGLALVLCLVLPLRVLLGGAMPEVYEANMERYKSGLIAVTIIYFIAATVYVARRDKTAR